MARRSRRPDVGALARWWPAVCAMVAFGPALASAPGRMPADTKLALYLDPARLTSEATRTFDAAQYGGWVPHQQIAYLWPTGPWYTAFDVLGVPDWVAHRLWIGTLLALAGIGVGWMLRRLGFGVLAALTGALLYQLSPYVLAYVSRTSSLLLPFAALGWIVGLTSLAIHDRHRVPWRWPVVIGLVVFSIGAPNATALIMIVAAPLAVLGAAAWEGGAERRRALIVGALTTVACTATSLWWVAMLAVQRANGADVLAYSESLRAVSTSSTALETLRGLGYWLFYVRDHVGATTSASLDHLDDGRIVAVGFAAALLPLAGLLTESSRRTRVGAWCVVTGVVVAVGIHPIDDPAPLVGALAGDTDSGLALALRSTARAVPVVLLGAAIGAAALVTTAPAPRRARTLLAGRRHTVAATGLIALAVAATPAWVSADLVDPDLDRSEQPPDSWLDAADVLDDPASATQRVLQIPGAEFGAFEWGVTVDQPLPYLIDRPVLTRDLLPLGSAPTMDLLFALDDRLQDGIAEPGAFGPVARWLGVSHVWLAGDLDVGRYDTARPGVTAEVLRRAALGPSIDLGVGHVPGHEVVDEELLGVPAAAAEIAPVRLIELDQPGSIVRVGSRDVVVVGSGDGLVDAAAAGVLDGDEVVRPALGVPDDEEVEHLVLTDSDRRRAHHWRSSQDVHGFTERADEEDLLRRDDADERLPVFRDVISGGRSTDTQTVAEHDGLVTAAATAYGAPFAHLPEHRPVMAIDGDPATAWTVAEHADPVGERLELTLSAEAPFPSDQLHLRQPWAVDDRVIVEVDLVVDGAPGRSVRLDERSWSDGGQRIALTDPVPPGGTVSIEIAEVSPGRPNGVGIAQADLVSGSITEWIRTPTQLPALLPDGRLDVVLTRLRAESTDRWRDDPEPTLRRRVTLPAEVVGAEPELAITIRLDPRADGATLARLLDDRAVSTDHLLGAPLARGHAAVDDDPTTAWITPFGSPIGPSLRLVDARGTTDRLALTQPSGPYSSITALRVADRNGPIDLTVDRDPARPDAPVTLDLPRIIDLASTTVTVIDADLADTIDRRHGDIVVLPAAISELDVGPTAWNDASPTTITVECADGWVRVDDLDVPVSFTADVAELLAGIAVAGTPCNPQRPLDAEIDVQSTPPAGFQVDRIVITTGPTPALAAPVDWTAVDGTAVDWAEPDEVTIDACPQGCWVVLGHGFNTAWRASIDGRALGTPSLVDGNANGWWLEPFTDQRVVRFEWTAQTPVDVGVAVSLVAVVASIAALVVASRRTGRLAGATESTGADWTADPRPIPTPVLLAGYVVGVVLLVGVVSGLVAGPIALVCAVASRRSVPLVRVLGPLALAALGVIAVLVVVTVLRERPPPDLSWPGRFDHLHQPTLLALATFLLGAEGLARRDDDG